MEFRLVWKEASEHVCEGVSRLVYLTKTHLECGQCHPMGRDLGWNKKEKNELNSVIHLSLHPGY